ncbi:hypothetical protein [Streptomyces sp. NPDC059564]|uniref:hypothetical protein n=1 Tax=Streptomyces sp. NPDC059564 TaxID=3346865 RepID=UPI003690C4F9
MTSHRRLHPSLGAVAALAAAVTEIQAAVNPVPYPDPDRTTGTDLYLKADTFRSAFAADLPASTTRVMQATQRPFSAASFEDTTQAAAWRTIPS